jgi:hypothetical protein
MSFATYRPNVLGLRLSRDEFAARASGESRDPLASGIH